MKLLKAVCLGLLVVFAAACGGGGSSTYGPLLTCASAGSAACTGGVTPPTPPAVATTLATSVSTLALSVSDTTLSPSLSGTSRTITVTNIGGETAIGVTTSLAASSSGFSVLPLSCGDIAPAASCILTVSPGFSATAAPGDTAPVPIALSIAGTNTNAAGVSVHVLTYGSVYQSGYVFSVDDTTPTTGSIGGKVVQLLDQTAVVWSATSDPVPGIDEANATNCDGKSDGACNTGKITAVYSAISPTTYAAGLCTQAIDGFSDWYLPAICELVGPGCGAAPPVQSVHTSLANNGLGNFLSNTPYWSSTLRQASISDAWSYIFFPLTAVQSAQDRSFPSLTRCARAITQ